MDYQKIISADMVNDLLKIMKLSSDNHEKADMFEDYLKDYGFKEIGTGTNVMCFTHKDHKHVVFKFALDSNGFEDNENDMKYCMQIPEYNLVYFVHSSRVFSIQRKAIPFTNEMEISPHVKVILKILKRLSKSYLLADMSPINFKNYGLDEETGKLVIIDGSDMIPLKDGKIHQTCRRWVSPEGKKKKAVKLNKLKKFDGVMCGGEYVYSDDYMHLICKECGATINPLELRRTMKEVNLLNQKSTRKTGLTDDEELQIEKIILARRNGQLSASRGEDPAVTETKRELDYDGDIEDESVFTSDNEILISPSYNDEEDDDDDDDEAGDDETSTAIDQIKERLGMVNREELHEDKDDENEETLLESLQRQILKLAVSERDELMSKFGYIYCGNETIGIPRATAIEIVEESTGISTSILHNDELGNLVQIVIPSMDDEFTTPTTSEIPFRFELDDGVVDFKLGEILTKLKYSSWA